MLIEIRIGIGVIGIMGVILLLPETESYLTNRMERICPASDRAPHSFKLSILGKIKRYRRKSGISMIILTAIMELLLFF